MWYKNFSKQSWNLRVWRKANILFNQDDIGMFKTKGVLRWKDTVFRMARSEACLRGFNFFFFAGMIGSFIWVKSNYYDPKYVAPKKVESEKELERLDAEADKILFKNRLEAYSRPHRSLEDLIAFLSGSKTFDQFADFISYEEAMNNSMDQQNGLDSWMDDQDQRMLKYYQRSIGRTPKF
ncbi:unnamed protein product (macronuclear) [Paramecium tetraurelia]|nr:uncharacterized protein GSPATT00005165001 [Paramecium tetraurelia]CAK60416.1 unnamed protein product [Paramecium tetraurelia]|eukprot:XP_001427814.1 hypothetical protein (macronuclear) [Paramecium tetraurelia strain d4-2]